jgi:hypothetical protein
MMSSSGPSFKFETRGLSLVKSRRMGHVLSFQLNIEYAEANAGAKEGTNK